MNSIDGSMSLLLFIIVIVILNIGAGFTVPTFQTLVNYYIPDRNSKERATIMSFAEMLVNLLVALFVFPSTTPRIKTTTVDWMLPACIVIGVAIVMHVLMYLYEKKRMKTQDKEHDVSTEFQS
jgi:MFS family permease